MLSSGATGVERHDSMYIALLYVPSLGHVNTLYGFGSVYLVKYYILSSSYLIDLIITISGASGI